MKRTFLLALLTTVAFHASSQNSILWEVSGNGLKQKSYVMGTLKFVGEKEFYLPPNVTALMKSCVSFAIEDQVDHHAQHELNKAIHFSEGQSLSTVMAPADYERLRALFEKEFKVATATFDKKYGHIKPLPLSIMMTRLSLGEKTRYYDIELLQMAKQMNLVSYSLESVEREAEALNKFPLDAQVKALNHSVENFDKQKEEFRKLMADYPKENVQEIYEYTLHPAENNPLFLEEFYFKRNEEWLPKIEKMMSESATFLAIGLSHLEGERGILQLLRSKGYVLQPVSGK